MDNDIRENHAYLWSDGYYRTSPEPISNIKGKLYTQEELQAGYKFRDEEIERLEDALKFIMSTAETIEDAEQVAQKALEGKG